MIPFWEGDIKQFTEAMKSLLNFDQQAWLSDWFRNNYRPGPWQMSFNQAIEAHDSKYKSVGLFPFIPKLMISLQDLRDFDPKWLESKHVLTCRGLSRSGYSGQITIWYDKAEYQIAQEISKTELIIPYLTCIYKYDNDPSRQSTVDTVLQNIRDEEQIIDFTLAQVQDAVYPYYVRAGINPPFTYHRKGAIMIFSINGLPTSGVIRDWLGVRAKSAYSFWLYGNSIGLWFDDLGLASYFRLKHTQDIPEIGKNRMVVRNS